MTTPKEVRQALQTAQSAWIGCDWDTDFGPGRINLRGLGSRHAWLAARATRGDESKNWREAYQFLDRVEQDAQTAATLASEAVDLWCLGNHREALALLEEAIDLEARYRVPIVYLRLRQLMPVDKASALN
jgi:hypothetical protein